ncbi:hypothetical protein [Methylomonas albis]|uniref:Uncharacterized protein n=1 Tax=Methylomonas albis TaxID=1854563 RepID=A0ABR9D1U2_9GAMM|nr:hypothetical protein [Methylomonas albis]MBD9356766.1 hypothetical protein [Methylomonas albis]
MQYLNENDVTQMMGIGYLGEMRQGPDGQVYQFVQGVDGLGNPIGGFWSRVKRGLKRALPIARTFAPFIPGGAAVLTAATPFLRQAGIQGQDGIGELYEAPDGNVYQVQGLGELEQFYGIDEDSLEQIMGLGYIGEIRQGPDGNLYQYLQGVDGLGNVGGFWSKLRKLGKRALQFQPARLALKAVSPYIQQAMPIVRQVASAVPGGAQALTAAAPLMKQAGLAGCHCQQPRPYGPAPAMSGFAEDELQGLDADEELQGYADGDLYGPDDELMQGLEAEEDFAGDDELQGFAEDQDMQGVEGYIKQDGVNGLARYEPEQPPQTRWHVPSSPPDVWKPLW